MEGPPLGPGGEDITWPDQVAPRGRKASSTRKIKPQTSNQAARAEQQSAAQYSDRAPLIPFQADLPRQRPRTPSYEQVMARPPLPSYDEVVGMTADGEEAEHGPSRSGLANP